VTGTLAAAVEPENTPDNPTPAETALAVSARGVTRRFGHHAALSDVDLALRPGEVHALLGENGAGKTTLVKILAGLETPDEGTVELWGDRVTHFDARHARHRGVALVQQHFTLVPNLTASQNLVLARPSGFLLPRRALAKRRLKELVDTFGLAVRDDVPVSELSVGEQQRLEILRALDANASVLLLDEPTAVLTATEATALLEVCRRLADEGRAVVIITHRLGEVIAGCDRVTVLRDGEVVLADGVVAEHTSVALAEAMVGRAAAQSAVSAPPEPTRDRVRVEVAGVSNGRLRDVSFTVHAGEVVGIAGVDGNGQAELEAVLAGVEPPTAGHVMVDGEPLPVHAPRDRVRRNVAYIPSDRYRTGIVRPMTLADNIELGRSGMWRVRRGARHRTTLPRLSAWDVRSRGPAALVRSLSGGNAQKLLLAREMHVEPSVVIACHPTRGLDPGAARTIADRILDAAAAGAAVVWVSVDLEELLAVSHRIIVLVDGSVTGRFEKPFDRNAIGLSMSGHE
jgi:simple sugar transport system ATP-binding protein